MGERMRNGARKKLIFGVTFFNPKNEPFSCAPAQALTHALRRPGILWSRELTKFPYEGIGRG